MGDVAIRGEWGERERERVKAYQNFPVDAITSSMPLISSSAISHSSSTPLKSQVQHYFNKKKIIEDTNINTQKFLDNEHQYQSSKVAG